jgi:glutamate synthase domain-containing protein 2
VLKTIFSGRYAALSACLLSTAAAPAVIGGGTGIGVAAVAAALSALGIHDLIQRKHAITRNYPVIGHMRFLIESIRPELRQYLFETDSEKLPFSRTQRSLVYARAKNDPDQRPFSARSPTSTAPVPDPSTFRIRIGSDQCLKPYDGSVLNISAMSFGALSANAIMSLNKGARIGGFAQDTGEGSISPYHREHGGDLVWQIASGYFGCRNGDGSFSEEKFARQAADDQVKMIRLIPFAQVLTTFSVSK